jgi:hypothetical protein
MIVQPHAGVERSYETIRDQKCTARIHRKKWNHTRPHGNRRDLTGLKRDREDHARPYEYRRDQMGSYRDYEDTEDNTVHRYGTSETNRRDEALEI